MYTFQIMKWTGVPNNKPATWGVGHHYWTGKSEAKDADDALKEAIQYVPCHINEDEAITIELTHGEQARLTYDYDTQPPWEDAFPEI